MCCCEAQDNFTTLFDIHVVKNKSSSNQRQVYCYSHSQRKCIISAKTLFAKEGERKLFLQTRLPKGFFAIYLSVIDKPGRDLFWYVDRNDM